MLCELENVDVLRRGNVLSEHSWSFRGWQHLKSLSLQAPTTADNEATSFFAYPTFGGLRKLHTLELTGFGHYELEGMTSTLHVLRLTQRQAGVQRGTLQPILLTQALSSNMKLDTCFFELLPAQGGQLAWQDGQQASVDVSLAWLRSRCRRLEVVGRIVTLDCACPRCAASTRCGYGDSDEEDEGWDSDGWGSEGGISAPGSVETVDEETFQQMLQEAEQYERLHPEEEDVNPSMFIAEQLQRAAAQLVAPGSLLERVTLRCSAPEHALQDAPGLMLSFCVNRRGLSVSNRLSSSSQLGAAVAAVNETLCGGAAAAAGRGVVTASFESLGDVPNVLILQRR
ncbi:N-ethylammeline chlorohydrolase [Chlorella sorokiniana]|uniref:N-ethylammeline chlorohydrolase n=1 Tax=Chlorella sorokiniana TaxID=3076 RepID=A0A2P6TYH5_CHLSO|nr:N-ethylammeline chlorohydrolase [Chlorella sorokiniana]|eukprot:PRW59090.1 N-ethylammeline chlorohydrolase [Chlorella sorokiniana]